MKIMLCCSAGMSTNLLVSKMTLSAKQRAIDCEIEAIPEGEINSRLKEADVFLLGPQVRYRLNSVKEEAQQYSITVAVIDSVKYSRMDGRSVLDQAIALYKAANE